MSGQMRVLLLGGGGREHALGAALATSGADLRSAPGNPGLADLGQCLPGVAITDPEAVADAAEGCDLVVVGPEAPLAAGVVDELARRGIPALGPTKAAARLESSKWYAKQVMQGAGVATAPAAAFDDLQAAIAHLRSVAPPYVVKADGLAAGKGVVVTRDLTEAEAWAGRCLDGDFGAAGRIVVIEEFLAGPEVSVFALCSGTSAVPLAPARDYKRLGDGDTGPNTGGMGSYSPVADLPAGLVDDAVTTVIQPVLAHLAAAGTPYLGFLYVGLVLTDDGPQVLEFNCRLGDPEAQVVLPRLSDDFAALALGCARGEPLPASLRWRPGAAVNVVLAAPGYPEAPRRGLAIEGVEKAAEVPGASVLHAGTARADGALVTAGGRVLNVVGAGADVATARERAYEAAVLIEFEGRQFRSDIGRSE